MLRQLWTMTASDLRQRARDKSVLIFGLIVPLALMFVMNLVFGGAEEVDLDPVDVAAVAAEDDELTDVLLESLTAVPGLDVTVERVATATEVRAGVGEGRFDMGLLVPSDLTASIVAGDGAELEVVEGDGASVESGILISVLNGVTDQMTATARATTAGATLDLDPARLGAVAEAVGASGPQVRTVEGQAATEQLDAGSSIIAGQAGLFLLFTVGFGLLSLLDERQQGTLARLQSMPMRRGLIPVAKALVSYILGVVATLVLLTIGSLLFDVSFGPPLMILSLVLCVVAAGTSLMFIVLRVARTAEQANIAQSILAIVLGMAGGAFFPISASGALGVVLDLNPIAAFTRGLGINAGGGGIGDLAGPMVIMLGFAAVSLVVSRLVPDRGVAA